MEFEELKNALRSPAYSPIHELLVEQGAHWEQVDEAVLAVHFGDLETEQRQRDHLGLCDVSGLAKLGVKGSAAPMWLASQDVAVPRQLYEAADLDDGGLVVRTGTDEFLFESGLVNRTLLRIRRGLDAHPAGIHGVERQDATFLLSGHLCPQVFAQICGLPMTELANQKLAMTRLASVSCGVLSQGGRYRIWLDPSYGDYLWQTLWKIVKELGGGLVGAASFYPNLCRK